MIPVFSIVLLIRLCILIKVIMTRNSNLEEIFDFSTSGKQGGTGFGMYLIRESLKDFKATIEIMEPIEHRGIHFKIYFK